MPRNSHIVLFFIIASFVFAFFVTSKLHAQVLVGWEMNGLSAYGGSPLAPSTFNANITVVGWTRGAGITTSGAAAGNAWGGNGMNETSFANAVAANDYVSFSISPNTDYQVSITGIAAYNVRRSGTGSTTGQWQYRIGAGSWIDIGSAISWGGNTSSTGNAQSAIDLSSITELQEVIGETIELRIVLWGGTSADGTWYINQFQADDDFIINGSVVNIPDGTPLLIRSPFALPSLNYVIGEGPSYSFSYTLSGQDLDGSGSILVDAPINFEISLNNSDFDSQLILPFENEQITGQPITIYARLTQGLGIGHYSGDILHSGGGANSKKVYLSGGVLNESGLQLVSSDFIYLIDFDNSVNGVNNGQFTSAGFTPTPSSGQLNSNSWEMTGWSDGGLSFGETRTTGDFARGTSNGNVTTGGVYSFLISAGNRAFGIQPGSGDWDPGSLTLKIQNRLNSTILDSISIAYILYVRNDQGQSNFFNLSYSTDNVNFISITELDFNSIAVAETTPSWVKHILNLDIKGLSIQSSNFLYLKWNGANVSGSGSRDEFALDDIQIVSNPVLNYPQFDGNVRIARIHGNSELKNDLSVDSLMVISRGTLSTINHKVIISPTATLSESNSGYLEGIIETTRDVTTNANSFGGIGITIDPDVAMGSTIVRRFTGSRLTGQGPTKVNKSLARYFQVIPTTNTALNASVVFSYDNRELFYLNDANEPVAVADPSSDLALYKRPIGGGDKDWVKLNGTIDTGNRTISVAEIDSFSEIVLGDAENAPLPVVLVSFSARRRASGAVLQWVTASEKDNMGFEVQRSEDGLSFRRVGWVNGRGTTTETQQYEYTDLNVKAGAEVYYRLQQVDYDGTVDFSPLIYLSAVGNPLEVLTYPVPAHEELRVQATATISSVQLIDMSGKIIPVPTTNVVDTAVDIDISGIPIGAYILYVFTEGGHLTRHIIKK